ncbi:MAG: DUF6174 domain-containing protein [Thermoleophilia bacterium]
MVGLSLLGLVLAAGGLTGCGESGEPGERVAAAQALAAARERWARSGSETYTLRQARSCFCTPEAVAPVVVRVEDGRPVELRWSDPTTPGEPLPPDLPTVDALFRAVEDGIADAYAIVVEYDPALGYPTRLALDPAYEISDEETMYVSEILTLTEAVRGDVTVPAGG